MRTSTFSILLLAASIGVTGCNSTGGQRPDDIEKALAQVPPMTAERIRRGADMAPDLVFPTTVSANDFTTRPRMAIYKPPGDGPFPALVLAHQCGGLRNQRSGWQNESMLAWAAKAVSRGYVVLLIDQLQQRGAATRCKGMAGGLSWARGVKDILQAADHLRSFEFVDRNRVAVAGFSFGAMEAVVSTSRLWQQTLGAFGRIDAAVAFYPGCYTIRPRRGAPYELVYTDIDTPLLVLMGADDTETPPVECTTRLKLARDAGAPVEWHVYPDTTHCWDCRNLDGRSKVSFHGRQVSYRYSEAATRDSEQRMFEFLQRSLRKPAAAGHP